VRADQEARRQVRTELAATRATARMVSGLPLLLLAGAQGAGARPWHVLLATLPGQLCLLGGVALVGAGLLWIERIARSAVEDP
jgi:tight adherence protein B